MEMLSDDQRRCLSVIYQHFHAHAAWPLLAAIRHHLFVADDEFPFVEVLETVPTSFQNSRPPDGEVWVTARGIRACAGRDASELADLLGRGWSPEQIRKS